MPGGALFLSKVALGEDGAASNEPTCLTGIRKQWQAHRCYRDALRASATTPDRLTRAGPAPISSTPTVQIAPINLARERTFPRTLPSLTVPHVTAGGVDHLEQRFAGGCRQRPLRLRRRAGRQPVADAPVFRPGVTLRRFVTELGELARLARGVGQIVRRPRGQCYAPTHTSHLYARARNCEWPNPYLFW
jgi:hypothetical protein